MLEAALEELRLLRMAEEMAGLARWRLDLDTRKVTWSREVFRIHGLPEDEPTLDFEAILRLYLPGDRERVAAAVEGAVYSGKGYSLDARLRRPDGEVRYITSKAECHVDETGTTRSIFGVLQDVTERSNAARFVRDVTDNLPGMMAYWDRDLTCRFANHAYLQYFGLPLDRVVGADMRSLWGETLFAQNLPHVQAALAGERQSFRRTTTRPSGELAHMFAEYIPDVDPQGDIRGLYISISDVTPLCSYELQLEAANAALVQACRTAEAAAAAKSEFLSNISHELRTPLTSIIGFSEVLGDRSSITSEDRTSVSRIQDASRALLAIINDILDFSKLEAGQVEIEPRVIDPAALAQSALDLFEPQTAGKGLYRRMEATALPARVAADDTRVRQILLNLIGNAIKFTREGGITLAASYDRDRQRLRYEVRDTGAGIPEERLGRLFQRFSQVDASTTRTFGGTGLGLAICRGLSEAMGGEVGVSSVLGQGSTFWVDLPCPVAEAEAEPASDEEAFDLNAALAGLRVLVVDDNPSNRDLVRIMTAPFEVALAEADGGAQAIAMARANRYDVILLDIRMPDIDGPTAARAIRGAPGPNQCTPIIGFTADYGAEIPEAWHGLFDARLGKPIVAMDLLLTLANYSPGHSGAFDLALAS